MGCRIRLIARAARVDGALDMAVEPLLLPAWHLLASVEEEYNAVYLRCASSGDLSLFGKGAGALPTATAVLGDLIDLAQDNSVRWPVPQALPVAAAGAAVRPASRRHYLRVTGEPHPGLERRDREPGPARRAHRAEPRHAHRGRPRAPRLHDLAEPGRAAGRRCARRSAGWPASRRAVPRGARVSGVGRWLDPRGCPAERPPLAAMARRHAPAARRARRARAAHRPRPTCIPTSRRCSSICSARRAPSRGRKARRRSCSPARAAGRSCRTSTRATAPRRRRALIARLEGARAGAGAVLVCDSGMQATALVFDVLLTPGAPRRADAAGLQQDARRTSSGWPSASAARSRSSTTATTRRSRAAIRPETRFVFAETFTNPLVRAQDIARAACGSCARRARVAPGAAAGRRLDHRHAVGVPHAAPRRRASTSCWPAAPRRSAAPTAICGATSPPTTRRSANAVMDLMAMRGGILDWRRAEAIAGGLDDGRARRTPGDRPPPAASPRSSPRTRR